MALKTLKPRLALLNPSRMPTVQSGSWRTSDQSSTARGYGYKWQQFRLRFLQDHPLCVMCEREGRVTEATVVDHVVAHRGDMTLFWKPGNHQALCATHHSRDKQREEQDTIG